MLALVISYSTARQAVTGHRVLGFLATAPIAIPGIVLGVGLFLSYTRPPLVLYGTLWVLLIAYITIELPAAYQQLQAAFRAVNPELEEASRILGATRCRRSCTSPRRCCGPTCWRPGVSFCVEHPRACRRRSCCSPPRQGRIRAHLRPQGKRRLGAISVLGLSMLVLPSPW